MIHYKSTRKIFFFLYGLKFFTQKCKLLVFYGCLLFYFITPSTSYTCIHNNVSQYDVPVGQMTYKEMRGKRDRHGDIVKPLIIHSYVDDIDQSIPQNVIFNIDVALKKVTKFFKETLQVRRTFNPFLLERLNCAQKWRNGVNKNKCSKLKSGPEFCSTKLTEYAIPDRYLSKLEVYDYADSRPRHVIQSGEGIKDANFILFVISRTTSWCAEDDVQAYGSYCRLDSGNRPVAGLINMCPTKFSKKLFKANHYFNVIMHEVIHVLGFSLHLYPKFKTCTSVYDCETPKKIVQNDTHGVERLVFPEVIKSMQAHLNCSQEDFGAPLEQLQGQSNASSENKYTSHWHPLLMYTSIMTPSLLEDSYVLIDNITLALLYSTGWYRVNFTKAQNFVVGKGQGCNFGFEDKCENSKHLCVPSNNATSCDILEYTIGRCESVVPYHPCGVFKPKMKETCLDEEGKIYGLNMRSIGYVQRCVTLQAGNNTAEPTCMVMKCKKSKHVEVLVNSSWVECPQEEKVEKNNVTINCPSDLSFCRVRAKDMTRTFCTQDSSLAVSIRMYFSDPQINELIDYNSFKNFKVSTIRAIAKNINVPVNYIINATLASFKTMYLDFAVCPPSSMSNDALGLLIKKTQEFLKHSPFTHIFKGAKDFPVAATEIRIEPDVAVLFSDFEGFHMLTIIPVICGVFVIVTFMASILRLILAKGQRKDRKTIEMEEINHSNINATRSNQCLAP